MTSVKRIIIIGATSGIGYEIAQLYRKQGWRIGICLLYTSDAADEL